MGRKSKGIVSALCLLMAIGGYMVRTDAGQRYLKDYFSRQTPSSQETLEELTSYPVFYLPFRDPLSETGKNCYRIVVRNLNGIVGISRGEKVNLGQGFDVAEGNIVQIVEDPFECRDNPRNEFSRYGSSKRTVIRVKSHKFL